MFRKAVLLCMIGLHLSKAHALRLALVVNVNEVHPAVNQLSGTLYNIVTQIPGVYNKERLICHFVNFPFSVETKTEIHHNLSLVRLSKLLQRSDLDGVILFAHMFGMPSGHLDNISNCDGQDVHHALMAIPDHKDFFVGLVGCSSKHLFEKLREKYPNNVYGYGCDGRVILSWNKWKQSMSSALDTWCKFAMLALDHFLQNTSELQPNPEDDPDMVILHCTLTQDVSEHEYCDEVLILDFFKKRVLGYFEKTHGANQSQVCNIKLEIHRANLEDPHKQYYLNLNCITGYSLSRGYETQIGNIKCIVTHTTPDTRATA